MIKTHLKKRIEMIIEAPLEITIIDLFDELSVKGYTIIPAIFGRGQEGVWRGDGLISGAGQMIVIVSILDPARVEEILSRLYEFMKNRIGIITISDVEVIRDEHF